tara:strand:- start:15473 stop:15796 length:324 start_codon:yes stop_codon:yes gene_type:complete
MKGYAEKKKDKKWSVAKVKVIDSPAVSEVKDDKGVVVRSAQAEVSHEVVQLTKKRWDSETGKAISDYTKEVNEALCDSEILSLENQIAELNASKDGWTALKADIKAL